MESKIRLIVVTLCFCILATLPLLFMKPASADIIVDNSSAAKIGRITMSATEKAPEGYLLCDGSAVSRTNYSALFNVIGTTYGAGDGSTTFNLPDYRGKVNVGKSSSYAVNSSGGEASHKLTSVPNHKHTGSGTTETKTLKGSVWNMVYQGENEMGSAGGIMKKGSGNRETAKYGYKDSNSGPDGFWIIATHDHTISGTTDSAGSSSPTAMNNMQPYQVVNYIIKY